MALVHVLPRVGSTGTLLLVDDDPNDALLFAQAAARYPFRLDVHWVRDGQQALDYLQGVGEFADRRRHPHPELVLLDLDLPAMSGFDFLRLRRNSDRFGGIPVLVWSGTLNPAWKPLALALGALGYLEKQADPRHWLRLVREVTGVMGELVFCACA